MRVNDREALQVSAVYSGYIMMKIDISNSVRSTSTAATQRVGEEYFRTLIEAKDAYLMTDPILLPFFSRMLPSLSLGRFLHSPSVVYCVSLCIAITSVESTLV